MKKFLLLFLCTATLFSACEKNNSDKKITETSPYEYYINYDNTAASKKYLGQETKVTIPENIEGHTVIACRPGAFSYTDVTEITFSSELKAFSGIYDAHSLETVNLTSDIDSVNLQQIHHCENLKYLIVNIGENYITEEQAAHIHENAPWINIFHYKIG